MKKKTTKRNFRKLPKYALGTMKSYDKGYQEASGIGSAQFTVQPGISIQPETQAIRQNTIPKALNYAQMQAPFITEMLKSTPTQIATTAATTSKFVPSFATNVPLNTIQAAPGTLSNAVASTTGGKLLTGGAMQQPAGLVKQGVERAGTSAVGTTMGAIGTALGAYTMANQIADFGSHRTGPDMMLNVGRQQYSTDYGNSYTNYTGVNAGQELDYERANARSKQLGFGVNAIGTGASLGGLLGSAGALGTSIGGPIGSAIGAGVGLLLGGLGSLLGWGDNEEEVQRQIQLTNDNIAMYNREQEAVAKSKDVAAEFNNRIATAATGKEAGGNMENGSNIDPNKIQPVFGVDGWSFGSPSAVGMSGELLTIGRGKDRKYTIIPSTGNKKDDNKDSIPLKDVKPGSPHTIIRKDLAKQTKDVLDGNYREDFKDWYVDQVEELQSEERYNKDMKKYKNGKLPGYSLGTTLKTAGRYLGVMSPNIWGFIQNTMDYNRASKAGIYSINPYREAHLAMRAVNDMYNIRYDDRAERNDAKRQLNFDINRIKHTPGLTAGGQEIAERAAFNDYTNFLNYIATKANQFNTNARMQANKEAINVGLTDQARGMQGVSEWYKGIQEGAGKKDFAMNTHQYNRYNTLAQAGQDLYKMIYGDRADENYKELIRMYRGDYTKDQIDFLNSLSRLKPAQINYNIPSASQTTSHIPQRFDDLLPWQQNELYNILLAQKMMGGFR